MRFILLAACLLFAVNSAQAMEPAPPPPGPVFIAAYADIHPAQSGAARALIAAYVRANRSDPGNVESHALQNLERGSKFVVIETWKDQQAFAAHEQAAHTQQFREQIRPLSRIPYDQGVHHGLDVDPAPATVPANAVYVVTHVDVRSQREQTEAQMKLLGPASRMDAGRLRYDVYQQNPTRTNHFTLFSIWNNRRAYDAHAASAHWQAFVASIAPLIGAPYDDRLFARIRD